MFVSTCVYFSDASALPGRTHPHAYIHTYILTHDSRKCIPFQRGVYVTRFLLCGSHIGEKNPSSLVLFIVRCFFFLLVYFLLSVVSRHHSNTLHIASDKIRVCVISL